eukprot:4528336-Lingulodinium_polyedra.AAC.1
MRKTARAPGDSKSRCGRRSTTWKHMVNANATRCCVGASYLAKTAPGTPCRRTLCCFSRCSWMLRVVRPP